MPNHPSDGGTISDEIAVARHHTLDILIIGGVNFPFAPSFSGNFEFNLKPENAVCLLIGLKHPRHFLPRRDDFRSFFSSFSGNFPCPTPTPDHQQNNMPRQSERQQSLKYLDELIQCPTARLQALRIMGVNACRAEELVHKLLVAKARVKSKRYVNRPTRYRRRRRCYYHD